MTRRPFFSALFAAVAAPFVAAAGPKQSPQPGGSAPVPLPVRLTIHRTGDSVRMFVDIGGQRFGKEYRLASLAEPGTIGPLLFEADPGGKIGVRWEAPPDPGPHRVPGVPEYAPRLGRTPPCPDSD